MGLIFDSTVVITAERQGWTGDSGNSVRNRSLFATVGLGERHGKAEAIARDRPGCHVPKFRNDLEVEIHRLADIEQAADALYRRRMVLMAGLCAARQDDRVRQYAHTGSFTVRDRRRCFRG